MSGIDNTTKRMQDPVDQWGFLLDSGTRGMDATIGDMEKTGQSQLVHSESLPSKLFSPREDFEALGFTFGEPDENDPLFMPATLPEGWEKRATDHSMGSVIVDTLGRERVSIFYKAAFYDRDAHMALTGLHWYVQKAVEYDGPAIIFDDEWATREAVAEQMRELRAGHLEKAAEFRSIVEGNDPRRDARNLEACSRQVAEKMAKAALYDAALANLAHPPRHPRRPGGQAMSTETPERKWQIRLDDGQQSSYASMQSAADMARTLLKIGHPCEMWHWDEGGWKLYERFEVPPEPPITAESLRADIVRGAHQIADWKAGR